MCMHMHAKCLHARCLHARNLHAQCACILDYSNNLHFLMNFRRNVFEIFNIFFRDIFLPICKLFLNQSMQEQCMHNINKHSTV